MKLRWLFVLVVCVALVVMIAATSGCTSTAEPEAAEQVEVEQLTGQQVGSITTDMTRAEIEEILGSAGSTTPTDKEMFDAIAKDSLSYRFWGDENLWVWVGFGSDDTSKDVISGGK